MQEKLKIFAGLCVVAKEFFSGKQEPTDLQPG